MTRAVNAVQAETVERSVSLNKLRKDLNKLAAGETGSSMNLLPRSPGITRLPVPTPEDTGMRYCNVHAVIYPLPPIL